MTTELKNDLIKRCQSINSIIRSKGNVGISASPSPQAVGWYKDFTSKPGAYKISRTQARHYLEPYGLAYLVDQEEPGKGGHQPDDLVGKKFGSWTVLERGDHKGRKHVRPRWRCRCDCGQEGWHVTGELTSGKSKGCRSCGQRRAVRQMTEAFDQWKDVPGIRSKQWHRIRKGAALRDIEFSITQEEAWDLFVKQGERCALTGMEITMLRGKVKGTASLDRIDSAKGYVTGNVQWVHKDVNIMKLDYDQDYFIHMCLAVANNYLAPCA